MAEVNRNSGHRRSPRRASRHRRMTVKIVTASGLLIGAISMLPSTSTWLQQHGVPVPHFRVPPSMWLVVGTLVIVFLIVFIVVELILLRKAIATVANPDVHDRYKALMLHWPYALLTPYTILKTHVLPRVFLGSDERRGADLPAPGSHRAGGQRAPRQNLAGQIESATATERPDAVTRDQYRSALALVINQIDSLTTDRELRDLLLEKYRSLEPSTDDRSMVIGDQMPPA
jgi:hypothetical protein